MEGCVIDDRGYVAESFCIYASCGMRVRFMFILANLSLSSISPVWTLRLGRQEL